jgi:ABC-2 type transport system permease protein
MSGMQIREDLEGIAKPKFVFLLLFTSSGAIFSLVQFVAFFGPLIGLLLGFDAINRERNGGTLSKLLSQPIYRDSVINGKFLAGVVIIAIIMTSILLVITGLGLRSLGVVPGPEEISRILIYLVISVIYISLWLGVGILFSILFRNVATSALASLAAWIFFSFFVSLGASVIAGSIYPDAGERDQDAMLRQARMQKAISLVSPMELYTDSTATIIDPMRKTTRSIIQVGMLERISLSRFAGPLPLSQSILLVVPYIVSLIAITVIFFALSYAVFMRQEIRSI